MEKKFKKLDIITSIDNGVVGIVLTSNSRMLFLKVIKRDDNFMMHDLGDIVEIKKEYFDTFVLADVKNVVKICQNQ